ncbi:MAG TPA: OmpA family protein [Noviherbaspirillum sp.]|jgi:outer membrane protein OmpA-like peptidoglycan-associated protein|uniref:OmpA family protein n=1 Tax=Noviherbaspirillum sp. TaxID=1926288 RepID=UPI002F95DD96
MRPSVITVSKTLTLLLATIGIVAAASAQEVTSLRGKPSSDMILQALTPNPDAPAAPAVRRRGLSLGNEEAPAAQEAAPAAAAPAAPSMATTAASADNAPRQVVASAPAQQARSQQRALDLDIPFQFNSDQLTNDGKDVLDQLATALKSQQLASARAVILEGHADAKGSAGYNQALSLKRAQSARTYLASRHGIAGSKLRAVGKGSSEPANPNNPEDEVNRRVRVIVDM